MTKIIVGDIEADGYLEEATKMHCIVLQELGTDKFFTITDNFRSSYLKAIKEGYTYVFHNSMGYDYPLVDRLIHVPFSVAPDTIAGVPVQIIDTLAWSRELFPDRPGGHSLKAWEEKVTGHKPKIDNWQDLSIDQYLHRCKEDVKLTGNVFEYLLDEAEIKL